ncbi:hypothetical protein L1276_003647 [Flavobacterium sp. HSC-32F16]|uniref:hypothetical protein n=1 Tax=Flavobacterium sp. HSC-32F16 TaxID=2910964 RepID=UPI0020A2941D|nr:hypothetical protein [Flavobacterium sp. HSC-32F16]MCP2028477.1 hypothetical protein [Flavobacterium sp. HSC-32F16]
MKNKLFISAVLIFVSCLTFSCTNDDYEIPQDKSRELKIAPKYSLNNLNEKTNIQQVQDSVVPNIIQEVNVTSIIDGDPSNPRPPRKD